MKTASTPEVNAAKKSLTESRPELDVLLGRDNESMKAMKHALGKIDMLDPRAVRDTRAFQSELRSISATLEDVQRQDTRHQFNRYVENQKNAVAKALNSLER